MPLKFSDGIGSWIRDFKKSDAPQFKGKSEKDRRDQAIAAYLSAKRDNKNEAVDAKDKVRDRIQTLQKKRQSHRAAIGDTDSSSEKRKHTMASQIATKQIQMAQQKMSQMEGIKFNTQDMVGHALKNVHKKKEEAMDRSSLDKAMAAFKKRGGKVTKVPAAKAQGYHGKDDPGKGIAGIMDRPDTKQIGTRKKVKSMEATQVKELSPATKKSYINKAAADIDNRSYAQGTVDATNNKYDGKNNMKIANRLKGIRRATKEAVKPTKATHVFDNEKDARAKAKEIGGKYVKGIGKSDGKHAAIKEGDEKPPFDPPYRKAGEPRKDKYGNVVKNVPRHLARKAARDLVKKKQNNEANLDELSYDKMNKYHDAAQKNKDKATNSAVATILRKGDHSKDLNTMRKREKGLKLAKDRVINKIRKGDKK
jgi:hypothetical protein